MTGILAIDTATEACSVAVFLRGEYREIPKVIPRQHTASDCSGMLELLLPDGNAPTRDRSHCLAAARVPSPACASAPARSRAWPTPAICQLSRYPPSPAAQTALRLGQVGRRPPS